MIAIRIAIARLRALFRRDATADEENPRGAALSRGDADRRIRAGMASMPGQRGRLHCADSAISR